MAIGQKITRKKGASRTAVVAGSNSNGRPPLLSICLIVRDNERTIRPCLESVAPVADELIVVDTGSRDATPQIAAELGARVFHFPWRDDFSAARNESLRHATGEWIFWLDSDDTMDAENGRQLRELLERAQAGAHLGYMMQVHCPAPPGGPDQSQTVVDHVKLFRNDPRIRFTGRIHEQVLPSIRALRGTIGWSDIFVVHSGADQTEEGRQRKYDRDLRLLRLELEENAEHPFVLFNFGMTYNDMGEHEQAVAWLQRSIARSHEDESHVRKAYALLAASLQALERCQEADEVCAGGLALFPQDVELLFRRGLAAHALGRESTAVECYQAALAAKEERHFTSIDRGVAGYKAEHNLALVYEDLGDRFAAERHFRRALREVGAFRPSWRGLMNVMLAERRYVTAELEIDRMQSSPELGAEAAAHKAVLLVRRGRRDEGLELARQVCAEFPSDAAVLQTACRLFFENGAWNDAEGALRRLAELEPEDAAVLHNLGNVLLHQGKVRDAIRRLESSLKLRSGAVGTMEALACAYQAHGQGQLAADMRAQIAAQREAPAATNPRPCLEAS